MKNSGIYKIQSQINPKRFYVGSAVDLKDRWRCHLKDLRKNKHGSIKLQRHYNKYNESDLVFIVLEPCFPQFLITREQHYINTLNPYFNICKIAGSRLGCKCSEETLKKMSEASKGNKIWLGKKHSEESKRKIGLSSKGRKVSQETRQKISKALKGNKNMLGKTTSEATKLKISKALKGRIVSDESRSKTGDAHKKPILQFDKGMNFIKEWDSSNSAIKELSLNQSNLSMCLNGRRRKTGGFIWKLKSA